MLLTLHKSAERMALAASSNIEPFGLMIIFRSQVVTVHFISLMLDVAMLVVSIAYTLKSIFNSQIFHFLLSLNLFDALCFKTCSKSKHNKFACAGSHLIHFGNVTCFDRHSLNILNPSIFLVQTSTLQSNGNGKEEGKTHLERKTKIICLINKLRIRWCVCVCVQLGVQFSTYAHPHVRIAKMLRFSFSPIREWFEIKFLKFYMNF